MMTPIAMFEHSLTPFVLAQADEQTGMSWLEMVQAGGVIGYVIVGLSVVAFALVMIHFVQIRRDALLPPRHLEALDDFLSRGDVGGALEYCLDPANDAYVCRIVAAGLSRFQKSAFGAFEIKNALEEAGEDQTARLYRSTDGLGVIGGIAPLLGLLGTVLGMIGAFETISFSAATDHEALASNISLALVTTLMGLTLAIPCIALYTFFRNRIDSLASDAGVEIERLALNLESAPAGVQASPAGAVSRPAPRNVPRPQPAPGSAAAPGAAPASGTGIAGGGT
jgi:biopolymer transport protein ExbB